MPQFDICSFSIQVFWLFVFLSVFYGILTCYVLPTILKIIKFRNKNAQEELLSSEIFWNKAGARSLTLNYVQKNSNIAYNKTRNVSKNKYNFINKILEVNNNL